MLLCVLGLLAHYLSNPRTQEPKKQNKTEEKDSVSIYMTNRADFFKAQAHHHSLKALHTVTSSQYSKSLYFPNRTPACSDKAKRRL